eukprot:CAMPEP_0114996206 /NCGR_PEP_ID=MMETSP0216-20121206/14174_1 /TAXON_ID=223996 /ORGANISM="Protocruzia adherens, Strain Boccale" /LENGTH=83 /DNA_ID=CAMNT_0002360369 /DNA_START=83 /DNA_END=334 /DNA_ORIENTATION=+
MTREIHYTWMIGTFVVLPYYWWGLHITREGEVNISHGNYYQEYQPRRLRMTHNLIFENFVMMSEQWQKYNDEYQSKGKKMLEE